MTATKIFEGILLTLGGLSFAVLALGVIAFVVHAVRGDGSAPSQNHPAARALATKAAHDAAIAAQDRKPAGDWPINPPLGSPSKIDMAHFEKLMAAPSAERPAKS